MVNARTVCCKVVMDTEKAAKAKIKGKEYMVCNENCKGFVQNANEKQIKSILQ